MIQETHDMISYNPISSQKTKDLPSLKQFFGLQSAFQITIWSNCSQKVASDGQNFRLGAQLPCPLPLLGWSGPFFSLTLASKKEYMFFIRKWFKLESSAGLLKKLRKFNTGCLGAKKVDKLIHT